MTAAAASAAAVAAAAASHDGYDALAPLKSTILNDDSEGGVLEGGVVPSAALLDMIGSSFSLEHQNRIDPRTGDPSDSPVEPVHNHHNYRPLGAFELESTADNTFDAGKPLKYDMFTHPPPFPPHDPLYGPVLATTPGHAYV